MNTSIATQTRTHVRFKMNIWLRSVLSKGSAHIYPYHCAHVFKDVSVEQHLSSNETNTQGKHACSFVHVHSVGG